MGISARWLRSLVGLRKVERQQHRKEDEDVGRIVQEMDVAYQFHCKNQHYQDHDNLVTPEEFPHGNSPSEGDCDAISCSVPAFSSLNVPLPQTEEELKEIWAATNSDSKRSGLLQIQTAFRAFLARRACRALKGLVRLQALVRGHIVRKQAAITLAYASFGPRAPTSFYLASRLGLSSICFMPQRSQSSPALSPRVAMTACTNMRGSDSVGGGGTER